MIQEAPHDHDYMRDGASRRKWAGRRIMKRRSRRALAQLHRHLTATRRA